MKYPINFSTKLEDVPEYRALRRVRFGKLGQKVLRDISAGMSPKAFDDYKAAMGKDFEKALEAIRTQDSRSDAGYLRTYSELRWLYALYKDQIDWSRYPCLFKDSPCFMCPHRSCGKPTPDVILDILEHEHCRRQHLPEKQLKECCCHHKG